MTSSRAKPPPTASPFALTFDDGPDPRWTPTVLDELERLDVSATFFVISARAVRSPDLIARMEAAGHSIGLHCREHLRHPDRERAAVEADTDAALTELASLGVRPRVWRTPWGRTAPWTVAIAAERGLSLVHWTLEPYDWRGDTAERMLAALAPRLEPGACVLLHDGLGPGARRAGCRETVRLIEPLVRAGRERGLEPAALEGGRRRLDARSVA